MKCDARQNADCDSPEQTSRSFAEGHDDYKEIHSNVKKIMLRERA